MNLTITPAAARFMRMMILADAQSRILLQGVTVDFVDSMSSQGLVFHDPKQVACSTSGGH